MYQANSILRSIESIIATALVVVVAFTSSTAYAVNCDGMDILRKIINDRNSGFTEIRGQRAQEEPRTGNIVFPDAQRLPGANQCYVIQYLADDKYEYICKWSTGPDSDYLEVLDEMVHEINTCLNINIIKSNKHQQYKRGNSLTTNSTSAHNNYLVIMSSQGFSLTRNKIMYSHIILTIHGN